MDTKSNTLPRGLVHIGTRVPHSTLDALKVIADREERSVAAVIRVAVNEAIAARQEQAAA